MEVITHECSHVSHQLSLGTVNHRLPETFRLGESGHGERCRRAVGVLDVDNLWLDGHTKVTPSGQDGRTW